MTLKEICAIDGRDEKEVRDAMVKEEWANYRRMTNHLHGRPKRLPGGEIMDYIAWIKVRKKG